jgi:hypothetical protein
VEGGAKLLAKIPTVTAICWPRTKADHVILIRDGRRGVQVGKGCNIRPLGGAHHDRGGAVVRKGRQLLLTLAPEQVSPNLKQHPEMQAGSGYGLIARRKWQDYPTHVFRHPKTRFRCQSTSHAKPLQEGIPFICVILRDGRYGTEGRTVRHGRHGKDGTVRRVGRYGKGGTDGSVMEACILEALRLASAASRS